MRDNGKSYNEIFSEKQQILEGDDYFTEKFFNINDKNKGEYLFKTNKSLVNSLLNHSGIFTVAIAGKAHIIDHGGEMSEAVKYVRDELEKGQDQNPYAILAAL